MAVVKYGGFVMNGDVDINNTVVLPIQKSKSTEMTEEKTDVITAVQKTPEEELAEIRANLMFEQKQVEAEKIELLRIKNSYIEQGTEVIRDAKKRADVIIKSAEEEAEKIKDETKAQCGAVIEQARINGEEAGFKKGYGESIEQCKAILNEAKQFLENINSEKEILFGSYEKEIFETVLEIANKVTLQTLTAKDSRVITKIINQASKNFRNSDYIKISLFKNEANEELVSDIDFVKSLVGNIKNVEVELLSDVDEGTVILDNGSEITDASISTQLRMIAELGRGKYKDKARKTTENEDETQESPKQKPRRSKALIENE